jgi:hypothetical protein
MAPHGARHGGDMAEGEGVTEAAARAGGEAIIRFGPKR